MAENLVTHVAPHASHFQGHRERLRTRFREAGTEAVSDYELLELVLFRAISRRDVKPLAKTLIATFGSFPEVISAPPARLAEIKGLGAAAITELKIVHAAAIRLARGRRSVLFCHRRASSTIARTTMALPRRAISCPVSRQAQSTDVDELQQTGTVDHTPVYPREVVKRALIIGDGVDLVHSHPSGDPTPSHADIEMTRTIVEVAKPLGIAVHDHIIVGRDGHASFKGLKLV
jgi:DNA repair protein RadC